MTDSSSATQAASRQARVSAFLHGRAEHDPGIKAARRGSHRTVDPEVTVVRLEPLTQAMGITRCANVTHLDRIGIPVTMVVRPNSRSVAVSQGKGLTLSGAKASGLMEAVETHTAERIDRPLRLGSLDDLQESLALSDLEALPKVAGSRFEPSRRLLWIEGQDLLGDRPLWLPYEMVHANYTLPLPPGSGCFPASTNGLASGNHILEAVCHGLCEVVERDAGTLWHLLEPQARGKTRLDLDTIDDADCKAVLERLADTGFEAAVWEATSDVGLAVFHCLILDRRAAVGHSGFGAGCHPDRRIALLRALLEAVQVRTTYIAGSRDDLQGEEFTEESVVAKVEQAEAMMAEGAASRSFSEAPHAEHETFAQDVGHILDRLNNVSIEQVLLVDLSPPEAPYAVVRVVVPGLEAPSDDESYVPGRRAARLGAQTEDSSARLGGRTRRLRLWAASGERDGAA